MRNALILSAAAVAGALILAPAAAAALPAGDYDFNLPGLNSIPVHVKDCGFECITLTTPSGFKLDMHVNREVDTYIARVDAEVQSQQQPDDESADALRAAAPEARAEILEPVPLK